MSEASDIRDLAVVLGRLPAHTREKLRDYASRENCEPAFFATLARFGRDAYYRKLCLKLGAAGCRAAVEARGE